MRDRPGRVFGVGLMARAAAEAGDYERAGLRWGAIEDEDAGAPLGGWRRHRQENEERIRELAGSDSARTRVREMTLDEAVALALDEDAVHGALLCEVTTITLGVVARTLVDASHYLGIGSERWVGSDKEGFS